MIEESIRKKFIKNFIKNRKARQSLAFPKSSLKLAHLQQLVTLSRTEYVKHAVRNCS